jgi:hypothetical protein
MRLIAWTVALLVLVPTGADAAADEIPSELRTVAELSDFRATASYDETIAFVETLAQRTSAIRLDWYGVSPSGRPMPLIVVGKDRPTPESAASSGKAIILVQNGIHAGEIDGKDASLMILRDIALGAHSKWLDRVVLLIVPIYNVDGHERVSPYNRANQDGPVEGMGFRTTADGHDLNRDHLKLETVEGRAMIGLFNRWRPHLHFDNHVTNGSDHDWVLTYTWSERPQLSAPLHAWVEGNLPAVVEQTIAAGHRIGPYVWLIDDSDPSAGFRSWVGEPRYATGYYPLRNRPSILVENHAYKPYRDRVLANRDFLIAWIDRVASDPRSLVDAVRAAERLTVAAGAADAPPSEVALSYEAETPEDTIRFPVYAWHSIDSLVTGSSIIDYETGEVREIEVPWSHRPTVTKTVSRPRGYLLLPGWPVIERRLRDHGLRVLRVTRPTETAVETIRLTPEPAGAGQCRSYQGLTQPRFEVRRSVERREVPAGALWIPADQPDFEVAVQLLEPEAPDSLVAWGLLSIVMERKEYIATRVLERLAREMVRDPAIRADWETALEDGSFAADPGARWTWWYQRTKFWDETVGLLPVYRVTADPHLATGPWTGPPGSTEPPARPVPVR